MVTTDDPALAARARELRDHAFSAERHFWHRSVAFNYRMGNLQAAVGVAQTERLAELVEARRRNARRYSAALGEIPGIGVPGERPDVRSVFWMYAITIGDEFGVSRDELRRRLAARGIETRTFFVPIHLQPAYFHRHRGERYPVAEELAHRPLPPLGARARRGRDRLRRARAGARTRMSGDGSVPPPAPGALPRVRSAGDRLQRPLPRLRRHRRHRALPRGLRFLGRPDDRSRARHGRRRGDRPLPLPASLRRGGRPGRLARPAGRDLDGHPGRRRARRVDGRRGRAPPRVRRRAGADEDADARRRSARPSRASPSPGAASAPRAARRSRPAAGRRTAPGTPRPAAAGPRPGRRRR